MPNFIQICCTLLLYLISSQIHPSISSLLKGYGALLYDAAYPAGPASTPTNSPGQWVSNIQSFNTGATLSNTITRLYPYSGDIKINCATASACVYSGPGQNVTVGYDSPAFGQASVASYRASFPNAMILAIIDADLDSLPLLNTDSVGQGVAGVLTAQICADPNVDGVFFDLEPISATAFESPGLFALYRQTAANLASAACKDSQHPNGRFMGIFTNPNDIHDWNNVAAAVGNNGFLAVGAYDVNDQTPPFPTTYKLYTSSVSGKIQAFMDPNSQQYKIPYTVVIPAASSFSEFEQYGLYNASYPNDFQLLNDYSSIVSQLGYVQIVRNAVVANAKSAYFLGMDYWSWGQYKSPAPNQNWLVLPNIPPANVIAYLQQSA